MVIKLSNDECVRMPYEYDECAAWMWGEENVNVIETKYFCGYYFVMYLYLYLSDY